MWQSVGLWRVWDASAAAGMLSPMAIMRVAPVALGCLQIWTDTMVEVFAWLNVNAMKTLTLQAG